MKPIKYNVAIEIHTDQNLKNEEAKTIKEDTITLKPEHELECEEEPKRMKKRVTTLTREHVLSFGATLGGRHCVVKQIFYVHMELF